MRRMKFALSVDKMVPGKFIEAVYQSRTANAADLSFANALVLDAPV